MRNPDPHFAGVCKKDFANTAKCPEVFVRGRTRGQKAGVRPAKSIQ